MMEPLVDTVDHNQIVTNSVLLKVGDIYVPFTFHFRYKLEVEKWAGRVGWVTGQNGSGCTKTLFVLLCQYDC